MPRPPAPPEAAVYVSVRVPRMLHLITRRAAIAADMTLAAWVAEALEEALARARPFATRDGDENAPQTAQGSPRTSARRYT
jgi:hypothetical protein